MTNEEQELKRLETLEFFHKEGGIYNVCSKVHMSWTGSSDPLDKDTHDSYIFHLLSKVNMYWVTYEGPRKVYDDSIKQLIVATLSEQGIDANNTSVLPRKIVSPDDHNSGRTLACLSEINGNPNKRCIFEDGHTDPHMTEAEYDEEILNEEVDRSK